MNREEMHWDVGKI
nr:hypothetical protein [Bacillus paranthracis]